MMHRTTDRFWQCYWTLPTRTRKLADKNFMLLKGNPAHPSLNFKKVGSLWSVRVGLAYRALAIEDADDYIWVWIGVHDEYEELIKKQG